MTWGLLRLAVASFASRKGGGKCLQNAGEGFLFVFYGGSPGWQEAGRPPTVETEILVSEDGVSIVDVVYNGLRLS